jgi:Tol biopolymer transport system component
MSGLRWATLAGTAVLALASPATARPLSLDDLAKLQEVESPTIDPSGNWVAYSVGTVDTKADKSFSHIWMTSWDGNRSVQLTNRAKESESVPRWSPDGHYLAFVSSRDDKHDNDQLWLLDRTGGEARPLTKLAGSVVDYAWSPDSRQIALVVLDPDPDADTDKEKAKSDDEKSPKPIVIDRFQFKRDIDGYLRNQRQRLVMFDVATGQTRRLTTGEFDEYLPAWSLDGSRIAFTSNRDQDPDRSYNYDLWLVPASATGAAPARLTSFAGADNDPDYESYPAWSPDGRSIAFVQGGPVELFSYGTSHLALVPASGGATRLLTADLDRNVGKPMWSADGKTLTTEWKGHTITLPANNIGKNPGAERHAMHGLILKAKTDNVSVKKTHDGEEVTGVIHAGDFGGHWLSQTDLDFTITLTAEAVEATVVARNVGKEDEPIAIGWHPYFAFPSGWAVVRRDSVERGPIR